MTKIKEELLKDLYVLKDKGVIDEEHFAFLKRKVKDTDDVAVLEGLYHLVVGFYKEKTTNKELEPLTPPTADEVCEALRERYNNAGIQYLEGDRKSFVYGSLLIPICWLKEDGTIYWGTNDLTPHLVTLIGRFYERELENEKR